MAVPVIMPRQGQSVETCIITEWHKKKGDTVQKGDILFSYETDKASFDHEAEEEGILLEIFFDEGEEVPVLENVAVVGNAGEPVDDFSPGNRTSQKEDTKKSNASSSIDQEEIKTKTEYTYDKHATKLRISPRAKKAANKHGVDLSQIAPSGPYGRIIERDVLDFIEQSTAATAETGETKTTKPSEQELDTTRAFQTIAGAEAIPGDDYEIKKLSNIRKIIARGMFESLRNSAQLTHHTSADARQLLLIRKNVKEKLKEGHFENVTINDMICYAVIKSLKKYPAINAHFLGDSTREFKKVHLGIAVDTERGLMVPVVKNADDLSLLGLSSRIKKLAESCRKGNIDPELLSGTAASFTVSNLGNYGVEMFTPVINLPQSGILGVNTIIKRPADVGEGIIGLVPFVGLSLTYDHRAVDGGPASLFLKEIKEQIENLNISLIES
jgi:pyruvate dehydrogenase E2 component (dihydrolipoamide acetyltransferase)